MIATMLIFVVSHGRRGDIRRMVVSMRTVHAVHCHGVVRDGDIRLQPAVERQPEPGDQNQHETATQYHKVSRL